MRSSKAVVPDSALVWQQPLIQTNDDHVASITYNLRLAVFVQHGDVAMDQGSQQVSLVILHAGHAQTC